MTIRYAVWDTEDDPRGNVRHIAEHGLVQDDVEDVLLGVHELGISRASGDPIAFGYTRGGDLICVVFEWIDDETVYPITAFRAED